MGACFFLLRSFLKISAAREQVKKKKGMGRLLFTPRFLKERVKSALMQIQREGNFLWVFSQSSG
jgi:hypothetical protein